MKLASSLSKVIEEILEASTTISGDRCETIHILASIISTPNKSGLLPAGWDQAPEQMIVTLAARHWTRLLPKIASGPPRRAIEFAASLLGGGASPHGPPTARRRRPPRFGSGATRSCKILHSGVSLRVEHGYGLYRIGRGRRDDRDSRFDLRPPKRSGPNSSLAGAERRGVI